MLVPYRVGDIIAGKYRVESILGEGGMGYVLSATHLDLDQRVALKFLRADARSDADVMQRFAREAKAAAKIRNEHVARVLDVGRLESGEPFIVMEHLEGTDLKKHLRTHGPVRVPDVVRWIIQAGEALAEAHARGIVHRDLKPANLYLTDRGDGTHMVKVLDFGISKHLDPSHEALTNSQSLMGTPYYMSPEQLTSPKRVDARTDLWALGVILFELLTGKPPFRGATLPEVVAAVLSSKPPGDRLPANVPRGLGKVVDKCLAHVLSERYQSVEELVIDLAPFCPDQGDVSTGRIRRLLAQYHRGVEATGEVLLEHVNLVPSQSDPTQLADERASDRPKSSLPTAAHRPNQSTAASLVDRPVSSLPATEPLGPEGAGAGVSDRPSSRGPTQVFQPNQGAAPSSDLPPSSIPTTQTSSADQNISALAAEPAESTQNSWHKTNERTGLQSPEKKRRVARLLAGMSVAAALAIAGLIALRAPSVSPNTLSSSVQPVAPTRSAQPSVSNPPLAVESPPAGSASTAQLEGAPPKPQASAARPAHRASAAAPLKPSVPEPPPPATPPPETKVNPLKPFETIH